VRVARQPQRDPNNFDCADRQRKRLRELARGILE